MGDDALKRLYANTNLPALQNFQVWLAATAAYALARSFRARTDEDAASYRRAAGSAIELSDTLDRLIAYRRLRVAIERYDIPESDIRSITGSTVRLWNGRRIEVTI